MNRETQLSVISYQLSVYCSLFTVYCLLFTGCASLTLHTKRISDEQNVCLNSAIIASLQKKSENLQTLKGSARIKAAFKDGREIAGSAAIIIKRPDRFRLEISGPFNQTAFIIIYNGKKMSLFSFQENKLYADYPLPVEASRLPQYLLGLPSSVAGAQQTASNKQVTAGCLLNPDDEQIFINQEGNIKEIILPGIKVSMDSYEETDGFNFPFTISINNKDSDVFIRYDHIELNRQISDDFFNPLFP